jgi:hypothetical protein
MCSFIHDVKPRAPTIQKTLGSRLGSLYYDSITILAILPRRSRHDQPNEIGDPVAGRQVGDPPQRTSPTTYCPARYRNMATRDGGAPRSATA